MAYSKWSLDQFAQHYAETLRRQPNGWGQHVSPIFGQSHFIMREARRRFPEYDVNTTFLKAIDDHESRNAS